MSGQKSKDNQYYTSSFYTAVFLMLRGLELISIQPSSNPNRSVFVLKDSPSRQEILRAFNFAEENSPEVLVDFRKAVTVIKSLKERLYSEKV